MAEKYQSKVKVIVRVRPFLGSEVKSCCVTVAPPATLELRNLKFNPPTEAISYKSVARLRILCPFFSPPTQARFLL